MSERTRIDDIRVEDRHRREHGDIPALAESMADIGLLQPVVITADLRLVAGERRLLAARSLGWETIPTRVVSNLTDAADLLRAEADENTERKEFTPTEAEAIAAARAALLKPAAEERERAGVKPEEPSPKFGEGRSTAKTSKLAAVGTGYSDETLRKVRETLRIAEDPETPEPVKAQARAALDEMDATRKVDGPYKAVRAARSGTPPPGKAPAVNESRMRRALRENWDEYLATMSDGRYSPRAEPIESLRIVRAPTDGNDLAAYRTRTGKAAIVEGRPTAPRRHSSPPQQKGHRPPLRDEAWKAVKRVRTASEALDKVTKDDRFSRNAEHLARHQNEVVWAIGRLQGFLDRLDRLGHRWPVPQLDAPESATDADPANDPER